MKITTAFPSAYLKASDLKGRKCLVTMRSLTIEEIGGEHKPVLLFDGSDKGLVLNKTNATIIADIYGDETDDWVGKKITIYPARVEFQGKIVDAIRVELQQRALTAQSPLGQPAFQQPPALGQSLPASTPGNARQAGNGHGLGDDVFPGDRGIPIHGDEIPF
jgi:hypothetical protein